GTERQLLAAESCACLPVDDRERLPEVEVDVRREPARPGRQAALELEQLAVRVVPVREDGERASAPRVRVHPTRLDHCAAPSSPRDSMVHGWTELQTWARTRSSGRGTRSRSSAATSDAGSLFRRLWVLMKRRSCSAVARPRHAGWFWKVRNASSSPWASTTCSTASAPRARISSSSRSASHTKK